MASAVGRSAGELLARLSADEVEVLVALVTRVVVEVLRRVDGGAVAAGAAPAASITGGASRTGAAGDATPVPGATHRFTGPVLVEHDVRDARSRGIGVLWLSAGTLVSPLAADAARAWGLDLEREA